MFLVLNSFLYSDFYECLIISCFNSCPFREKVGMKVQQTNSSMSYMLILWHCGIHSDLEHDRLVFHSLGKLFLKEKYVTFLQWKCSLPS